MIMGLQIGEIIRKEEISLDDLKDKVMAIDAFNTLYQFLTTIRQPDGTPLMDSKGRITSHLSGLFYRTTSLMSKGLKPIFVFDGKAPELKEKTHEIRAAVKKEAKAKFETADKVEEKAKWAARISFLTDEMIEESKELIAALGLPFVQAPSEGEAQAAFLVQQGDAYAVGSQDYDSLLFGASRLVQNLTLAKTRRLPSGATIAINPQLIELEKVLNSLQLTREQLICLGILTGTDYNPGGIKGIGPKTALKIVKMHKSPALIFKEVEKEKRLEFDWREIFEFFKKPDVTKKYSTKFRALNEEAVKKILVKKHDFGESRIKAAIARISEQKEAKKQKRLENF